MVPSLTETHPQEQHSAGNQPSHLQNIPQYIPFAGFPFNSNQHQPQQQLPESEPLNLPSLPFSQHQSFPNPQSFLLPLVMPQQQSNVEPYPSSLPQTQQQWPFSISSKSSQSQRTDSSFSWSHQKQCQTVNDTYKCVQSLRIPKPKDKTNVTQLIDSLKVNGWDDCQLLNEQIICQKTQEGAAREKNLLPIVLDSNASHSSDE
ncbi:unnamed protein product [Didymodactylos carnosus]|uniref:Uncharacterized protein n=1 Tax=Didymodactylos carnosus TaxID=1234261 RepID=A0A8S2FY73_9BILA|nr:unnamed protein product [Didymodactylos carnosus]CAF4385605.1 unnamed protein product [Didymodactylos carnosus]